ncbi:MAG: DUF805 domain-containing protein [Verrucomicrobia bacterium]|nr:DUF805 domain-containing protein [Verrucomicrobiota bacterium]MBI3867098.1 DUF805 domain-containing protein [Verrucomicrobiota bacterium]
MKTKWLAGWVSLIVAALIGADARGETVLFSTNRATSLVFARLTVGSNTFTNVTIGARTPTDVFLRHQGGLVNVKVDELSHPQLVQLGYEEEAKESRVGKATAEAKSKVQDVVSRTITAAEGNEKIAAFAQRVRARFGGPGGLLPAKAGSETSESAGAPNMAAMALIMQSVPNNMSVILSVLLVAFPILYFFGCYTARMVCTKAGAEPGFLIWLPILSMIPLMRAAGLPGWMSFLLYVPVVNLVLMIVWCFKISQARGKSGLTALALIFPLTSPFAWLYLAYSK